MHANLLLVSGRPPTAFNKDNVRGLSLIILLSVAAAGPAPADPLKTLDGLLKKRKAGNEEILAALDAVEAAYRAGDEKFKKVAERSYLKALALKRVPAKTTRNERQDVQVRAAHALGRTRADVARAMMRTLELKIFKEKTYVPGPIFYEAVFDALAKLDAKGTSGWLLDEAIDAQYDDDSKNRTLAAIQVLPRLRSMTPRDRREAIRRLLALFQSFSFHVKFDYYDVAGFRGIQKQYRVLWQAGPYWVEMRPVIMATLRTLATDPRTGRPPLDLDTGEEIPTVSRFKVWFGQNKRLGHPPWIDGEAIQPPRTRPRYTPPISTIWRKFGAPWTDWWDRNRQILNRRQAARTGKGSFLDELRQETLPPVLLVALADKEPSIRAVAALNLGKMKATGAAGFLQERLERDPSEMVREGALLGLLLLQDKSLAKFFQKTAQDGVENPRIRAYALLALGFLKEAGMLRKYMASGQPEIMRDLQACRVAALGFCGDPKDAPGLGTLLADRSVPEGVRGQAGAPLLRLRNAEVLPDLLRVLREHRDRKDKQVPQIAAAIAFGGVVKADDQKTMKWASRRLLADKGRFAAIRMQLAMSLGRIGAAKVLFEEYDRARNSSIRYAERGYLLLAIGMTGTPEAKEMLRTELRALKHEFDLAACALGLALAKDKASASDIRALVFQSKAEFAAHGMIALAILGDKPSASVVRDIVKRRPRGPVLKEGALALALMDRGDAVKDLMGYWDRCRTPDQLDALAWAFSLTGSQKAVEPLLAIYKDDKTRPREERVHALAALGRLADPEARPLLNRFAPASNVYDSTPTLLDLARKRDLVFLR